MPGEDTDTKPQRQSIAVLAFANVSGEPDQDFFSDGVSEDILIGLSKVDALHVIARNSSFSYKQAEAVSIPTVGRELGVAYVVDGSVANHGGNVSAAAQLIDAATGASIWSDRGERSDILALQNELTRQIVAALDLKLTPADQRRLAHARDRKIDPRAYELYLRARQQVWTHTKSGNASARSLLAGALQIDGGFAAAHAINAFAYTMDYANGWSRDPDSSIRVAMEMAEQGVALDGDDSQTRFGLAVACLWSKQIDRALREADRCVALEPSMAEGFMARAHSQIFAGESAAALATLDTYFTLDPLYPDVALYFLADAHFNLGEYDAAIQALQTRLARNPQSPTTHAMLASCFGQLGRDKEAHAAWQQTMRADPDFSMERRRAVLPYKNPEFFERRVDGLRKAGLIP